MAVTEAFVPVGEDFAWCLLIDSEADSIEIVHPHAFTEDGHPMASYYQERPVSGDWGSIMIRRLEETALPVGLRVEGVSSRFRPKRLRKYATVPQVIKMLVILAGAHLGQETTEPLIPSEQASGPILRDLVPALKLNGDR